MVRHNAVRSVDAVLVLLAELARIWAHAGELLDALEDRRKHIRVVVGALVLHDGYQSLEAHARVDVLRGERP